MAERIDNRALRAPIKKPPKGGILIGAQERT